jgi:hypothetical protein
MLPEKKQSETYKIPHKVPVALVELINEKCDIHLPRPQRKHFFQLLLDSGMDSYEFGDLLKRDMLPRPDKGDPLAWTRFPHETTIGRVYRFNELHAEHLPQTSRREFFEYILMLGIQWYEKEYTIYGFRKD